MTFLMEAMRDGTHGNASAKRFALVLGAISLSIAVVASLVRPALDAMSPDPSQRLALHHNLVGVAYVGGKAVEK